MISALSIRAREVFQQLSFCDTAVISETEKVCRIDNARCSHQNVLNDIRALASMFEEEGLGSIDIFGSIRDRIDLGSISIEDLDDEDISIVLKKSCTESWTYFVTVEGFRSMLLDEGFAARANVVWMAGEFDAFASKTTLFTMWGGAHDYEIEENHLEQPRKLVRDHTHRRTTNDIAPWILVKKPNNTSPTFAAWRSAAIDRLVYALPSEIRNIGSEDKVVLKGPRSVPLSIERPPDNWEEAIFPTLQEAVSWIYITQRDAETKFNFINNHLSLDWRDDYCWPEGLCHALESSLISAKETFSFYLQDQSKDALKTLGDIRKGLQEEVSKTQQATRDLLSALWRDLAIAGVVLALRSPVMPGGIAPEVSRYITLATAALLFVSLVVTTVSNSRFNNLSDKSRSLWRSKLYAFITNPDWERLVEQPIRSGRKVYGIVLLTIGVVYAIAIYYLLRAAYPDIAADIGNVVAQFISYC